MQVLAEVNQTVLFAQTVQDQTSLQLRNNAVRHADVPVWFRI